MTDPITITLTSEEQRQIKAISTSGYGKAVDVAFLILDKIRAAQAPSYTRVQVLRMEWEPSYDQGYMYIDGGGVIHAAVRSPVSISQYNTMLGIRKREGCSFAPTHELAEELSQVIQGKYRPSQQDIDVKVPFWIYFPQGQTPIYEWDGCRVQTVNEKYIYFFTEAQRRAFIQSREAEQVKKEPQMFRFNGGIIEYGNSEIGFSPISTFRALNAMLNFCREKGFTV